jgi:hypothetical protein
VLRACPVHHQRPLCASGWAGTGALHSCNFIAVRPTRPNVVGNAEKQERRQRIYHRRPRKTLRAVQCSTTAQKPKHNHPMTICSSVTLSICPAAGLKGLQRKERPGPQDGRGAIQGIRQKLRLLIIDQHGPGRRCSARPLTRFISRAGFGLLSLGGLRRLPGRR